jgi:predicted MFS family arabinose efflux permease
MLPLTVFFYRNRPEDVGQTLDGLPPELLPEPPRPVEPADQSAEAPAPPGADFTLGEAVRTRPFWIVTAGTGAFAMLQTAVFFSLVPIFQDRGLSEADAVGMLSAYAASMAAMHLVGGFLADRLAAPAMLAAALGLLAASLLTLRLMSAPWCGHLAGVTMGAAQGLYFGASGPLWARYFGRLHLGKIRGVLMTAITFCSSLGPLLVGVARDHFGNHDLVLAAFALVPLPLAALAVLATPPQKCHQPQPALAGYSKGD